MSAFTDTFRETSHTPKHPVGIGFDAVHMHVDMSEFLNTPGEGDLDLDYSLYTEVDRMLVVRRDGDRLTIKRDDGMHVLNSFISYLTARFPHKFVVSDTILLQVQLDPIHAQHGGTLEYAPIGCSVGGTVWWNPSSVVHANILNQFEPFFRIVSPYVYPGHMTINAS